MTERPIIFSAPMVRALLEGRKTQTRRIIKPPYGTLEYLADGTWKPIFTKVFPGDRLWVREAWRSAAPLDDFSPSVIGEESMEIAPVRYEADGESVNWVEWRGHDAGRLRPSIHMPRWASRLTLTVTNVRVQRLQDISEEDAFAEGFIPDDLSLNPNYIGPAKAIFEGYWSFLHGPGSWDENPWVSAVTFVVECNNIEETAQ